MDIEILTPIIESKIVEINGQKLEVYTDGRVYKFKKNGDLKLIKNIKNTTNGYNSISCYNSIGCNCKQFYRHRIIAYTFLNLDINNSIKQVDHIDGIRLNNCLTNLRVVTSQHNSWNRTTAKGFYFNKSCNKWRAYIGLNRKEIHLGYFNTEEEARTAYLKAKDIYHIIQ